MVIINSVIYGFYGFKFYIWILTTLITYRIMPSIVL